MNWIKQTKDDVAQILRAAAEAARTKGELEFNDIPDFVVEIPREKSHGDFAANIAMLLARQAKKAPRQIAEILIANLDAGELAIEKIEVAGAGFINFYLRNEWLAAGLAAAAAAGEAYGESDFGQGKKVQVEFVSANPTGELHMGNARGAALGDSLASIMAAAGFEVEREYYINDAGNQIEKFGLSLEARYLQELGEDVEFPEDGYHGEDIRTTMRELIAEVGNKYQAVESAERRAALIQFALGKKVDAIRAGLERFGVNYDVWFSEQSLHDSGVVLKVVDDMRDKGLLEEKEGAMWFCADKLATEWREANPNGKKECPTKWEALNPGGLKPEVLLRANGVPTYYTADIAYHINKFERGFDRVINIWGADHHGHVARLKAGIEASGYDCRRLDVILMQLVRLFQGGEIVRMSKRAGTYVTLEELMDEVGVDAARFFFVMRSADSQMDFDLDLAKSQSSDNPVYYVQYAHARICSILRQAAEAGAVLPELASVDFSVLQEESERDLIRKILNLPEEIVYSADNMAPHCIATYVLDLAGLFHGFYNNCRVLGVDENVQAARLWLCKISAACVKKALGLLGVNAPERM